MTSSLYFGVLGILAVGLSSSMSRSHFDNHAADMVD